MIKVVLLHEFVKDYEYTKDEFKYNLTDELCIEDLELDIEDGFYVTKQNDHFHILKVKKNKAIDILNMEYIHLMYSIPKYILFNDNIDKKYKINSTSLILFNFVAKSINKNFMAYYYDKYIDYILKLIKFLIDNQYTKYKKRYTEIDEYIELLRFLLKKENLQLSNIKVIRNGTFGIRSKQ